MNRLLLLIGLPLLFCSVKVQAQKDSLFIRSIFDLSLEEGHAYEDLRSLCKDIGHRITGSAEAEMAVQWGKAKLDSYGIDKVYLQEIQVPHWERGTTEAAWIEQNGNLHKLNILALGGSIGTYGKLEGQVVSFPTLDALKKADPKQVQNKMVYISQPMDQKQILTFKAYGGCWPIRGHGAIEAGRLGAKAVIIRSLSIPTDNHAHTGSMYYDPEVDSIPAAAIATKDAELLDSWLDKGTVTLHMEMDCQFYGMVTSHNVIGEIKGRENPEEIITIGGHLDSWDVGEGAHDDGAGIVHCIETFRIFKALNYQPKHTLRIVLFMNEENGNFGGKSYATIAQEKEEKHIAALESDRGGFSPRGFDFQNANEENFQRFKKLSQKLYPFELNRFQKGYGGVDIAPLRKEYPDIALFGLAIDSQRYFDFHHSEADVFESVNKRELAMGCAAMASFLYLIDQYFFEN